MSIAALYLPRAFGVPHLTLLSFFVTDSRHTLTSILFNFSFVLGLQRFVSWASSFVVGFRARAFVDAGWFGS